ncbi:hypothetical protein J7J00_24715 [Bacillus sp. ISL-4]|uniref:hypothetical protein n=1 Tax=Bacillus sp. ISL-4 TaxID=2819125 RepID=UPI001BE894EC|nr:hypothetical protein [Bacillus sp. ISL-4]MBT2668636.1 hypothetical protein [Bacillus sp. ISL-4]MBT2673390.1 hypothetical protein [Streptomyces sp. ISL-14]
MATKCHVVISTEKEIIKDKDLIFNYVKKDIKKLQNFNILSTSISNSIRNSCDTHKQVVQEQKTIMVDLNLPINEFPINELEYRGNIYPFSKTRLTVNGEVNYPFITYIFDGGKEKLDLDPLFEEFIESLKKDEEFAEFKKRTWPNGFTNKSDKEIFEDFFVES